MREEPSAGSAAAQHLSLRAHGSLALIGPMAELLDCAEAKPQAL